MKKFNILTCAGFILGSEILGSLGSFFTTPNIPTWYWGLARPALNPPNWIFAPVWTILFALMGISAYLVWQKGTKKKPVKTALTLFIVQFVFNILWSAVFFGLHSPLGGLMVIVALWLGIIATLWKFYLVDRWAGYLLVPYLLWVTFAMYLNASIFLLN